MKHSEPFLTTAKGIGTAGAASGNLRPEGSFRAAAGCHLDAYLVPHGAHSQPAAD